MIKKYLQPRFGRMCLRDLRRQTLQQHFSGMAGELSYPTISKIRDVLSCYLVQIIKICENCKRNFYGWISSSRRDCCRCESLLSTSGNQI
jgi:hypothetical protein